MPKLQDYINLFRFKQPTGIWLLFLPALFGIFLSLKNLDTPLEDIGLFPILNTILLFLIGSIIMRPAGCIINDMLDHKFDRQVARTKNRPIASGRVSLTEAAIITALLLSTGLIILLQFNQKTIISGFFALILVATYPLMKRITYYPQIFLGLTFNFGVLMGSLAMINEINSDTLILYFACIIWTLIYDTIYAYQDIEDDLKIGVKSTAIKFRNNPKKVLLSLNLIMFLTLILLGWRANLAAEFFLTVLLVDLLIGYQINKCDFTDSATCLKTFKNHVWVGLLLLLAIILG